MTITLKNKRNIITIVILLLIYLFFRFYNHSERVNFADDQGTLLLDTYEMWQNKKPKLVGPKVLSFGSKGRYFFHGPYVYYLLLPGLLVGNWDPIAGSIITILWNAIGVTFLYFIGLKFGSKLLGILMALIYSTNPILIDLTSFIWNPNFLPFISVIISYLLINNNESKINRDVFLLGLLFGSGILFHYQMILIAPFIIGYFLHHKYYEFGKVFRLILGGLIGLSPLLIFELKHDFYNIKTLFFILNNNENHFSSLPIYYFLTIIIIVGIMIIVVLFRISSSKYKKHFFALMTIATIINIIFGISSLYTNPKRISLSELRKASKIIQGLQPEKFNIANLTTGNTRGNALRYILLIDGVNPMGVEEYPQAENLFVLSDFRENEKIEQDPVWEISIFQGEIIDKWELEDNGNYYLYWLKK